MKYLWLSFFFSVHALACWKMQATLSVHNDTIEINQKVDHDKTYSFSAGSHLFHIKIPSQKSHHDLQLVEVGVQEKKGIQLSQMHQAKVTVKLNQANTLIQKDNKTNEQSTFVIKLSEI